MFEEKPSMRNIECAPLLRPERWSINIAFPHVEEVGLLIGVCL